MVSRGRETSGRTVVISQPMYFPWLGLFEQMRAADVFIHYDDVQLARGFYNRVQVKTPQGTSMITVPLKNKHRDSKINDCRISYESDWVSQHRAVLTSSYKKTPYLSDAIAIFDDVTGRRPEMLGELGISSIMAIAGYLGLTDETAFLTSSDLDIAGSSSQRLLDISAAQNARIYLTGHGALNYLNHELFESRGVEVRYIKYGFAEYAQVFGEFTPYVTALDAIAHLGHSAVDVFESSTLNWRNAVEQSGELRPRV